MEREYEDQHVHQVYEQIASHFSETRFKPWPVVDSFLRSRRPGSVGLDVGCGNGKYLTVNRDVFIVASDRSANLIEIASGKQHQPHSAVIADSLSLPHPHSFFDFVISIAVVHHLSTRDRRREALRCILDTIKPTPLPSVPDPDNGLAKAKGGEALIFVWALEQKNSRRGWDRGDEQDVLVPWVLKASSNNKSNAPDAQSAVNVGEKDRKDRGGNLATQKSTTIATDEKAIASSHTSHNPNPQEKDDRPANGSSQTFQRYYHLYREGELEEDIEAIGGSVIRKGYDRDNWWAIFTKRP